MRRRRSVVAVAAAAAFAVVLAGCSKSATNTGGGTGGTATAEFNAGVGKMYNPSDTKGGTLRVANAGDWDSLDPADTYYGYSWDFIRLYTRSLVMFANKPGTEGTKLVPDLAQDLGKPSDNNKTWTYKLRPGLKYEDGTPITSKDVKYNIERSLDKDTFPNGPTYLLDFLDTQGYTSPYKDTDPNKLGLKAVETPDDQTIIFHLKTGFSGFDYFMMIPSSAPVPPAKDTGSKYKEHVISSGPYKFETNELGKRFTLVRNSNWDPATDPNRKALPDRIEVSIGVNGDDIDNRLIAGDLDVDIENNGLRAAAQTKVLNDPSLKKNLDNPNTPRLNYVVVNPDVAPFNNIHCRKAVEYATDHEGYQRAYGGPYGGDIATNLMPPQVPGAQKVDLYNFGAKPNGDLDMAKKELADCGMPNGFTTNMSFRTERLKEKALAETMQQALAKVGINLTLKGFPQSDYFKLYAGKPAYAKQNGLGLMTMSWGADWNDGFGFLQQIVDSRAIKASGNSNLGIKIPEVDMLLDKALAETDTSAREKIWGQIDKRVMEEAVVVPGTWAKLLVYRPPTLTNFFISDGLSGYPEVTSIGVKK